jgi:hypothetical protein
LTDQALSAEIDTGDIGTAATLARLNRSRIGGAGVMALGVANAATSAITHGRVDQATLMSTASSAAAMIGMRLIPGVGWAATAYTVADLGSRALVGKPFGETMVGKPIDWALDKAGRGGLAAAKGAMDLVGWKGGSDFMRDTIYPWAYPGDPSRVADAELTPQERADKRISEAREAGLLPREAGAPILMKGPSHEMSRADTLTDAPLPVSVAAPVKNGNIDLLALAAQPVRSTVPVGTTIQARRNDLLVDESIAADPAGAARNNDTSLVDGRRSSSLAAAVSAEAAVAPVMPQTKTPTASKPIGRDYDE